METKVKQLHTSANGTDKENSSREELVKRKNIENTPFEIITIEGRSFGAMGSYRVTEAYEKIKDVEKELTKITWDRIVQVIMILNEVKSNLDKTVETTNKK